MSDLDAFLDAQSERNSSGLDAFLDQHAQETQQTTQGQDYQRKPWYSDLGSSAASVADIVAGVVPAVIQTGTYAGARTLQQTPEQATALSQKAAAPFEQPFGRAFGVTESPAYKQEASRQILDFIGNNISKGTKWISQQTGLPETDVANMANTLSFAVGPEAARVVKGEGTNLLHPIVKAEAEQVATKQAQNVVRDKIWEDSRKAGFVVPKSAVEPTTATSIKERAVGKEALSQKAQLKNQDVTNDLIRKEFGISKDTPLSEELFDNMRNEAGKAYEEVKNLPLQQIEVYNPNLGMNQSKQLNPKQIVEDLRQSRADARDYWKAYKRNADPETQKKAIAMDSKSANLEFQLDQVVQAANRPELANNLRDSRTKIAKIYAVENAFNPASQNIDPVALGRMLDKGIPLTGNLRTVGDFSRRFPGYVKEGSKLTSPGADAADTVAAFFATLLKHPVAAATSLLRAPARSVMLSEPYQNMLVKPNYGPNSLITGARNALANTAVLSAATAPVSTNMLKNQGQQ